MKESIDCFREFSQGFHLKQTKFTEYSKFVHSFVTIQCGKCVTICNSFRQTRYLPGIMQKRTHLSALYHGTPQPNS